MCVPDVCDQTSSRDPCPAPAVAYSIPSTITPQEPNAISHKLITKPPACGGGSQPSPALLPKVPAGSFN